MKIGIDIGGKHVGMGIVDEHGKILKKEIVNYEKDFVQIEDIFNPINDFLENNISDDIECIGVGIPGISSGRRKIIFKLCIGYIWNRNWFRHNNKWSFI